MSTQSIDRLILHHVQDRQTTLVNSAIEQGFFNKQDVRNLLLPDGSDALVQQWYLVTEWLGRELLRTGGVVLMNEFGCWWGVLDVTNLIYTHEDITRIQTGSKN